MEFTYSDGGRSKYFSASNVGDCATRAIANATGIDYKLIYDSLCKLAGESVRNGCPKKADRKLLDMLGWEFTATMGIGTGCRVHLSEEELPDGVLVVHVSKHLTCVKDGAIYDTYDCSRSESRCVYGYNAMPKGYSRASAEALLRRFLSKDGKPSARSKKTHQRARRRVMRDAERDARFVRLTNEQAEYLEALLFHELDEEYVYQMESPRPVPSRYAATLEILKKVYKAPVGSTGSIIRLREHELEEIKMKARL